MYQNVGFALDDDDNDDDGDGDDDDDDVLACPISLHLHQRPPGKVMKPQSPRIIRPTKQIVRSRVWFMQ